MTLASIVLARGDRLIVPADVDLLVAVQFVADAVVPTPTIETDEAPSRSSITAVPWLRETSERDFERISTLRVEFEPDLEMEHALSAIVDRERPRAAFVLGRSDLLRRAANVLLSRQTRFEGRILALTRSAAPDGIDGIEFLDRRDSGLGFDDIQLDIGTLREEGDQELVHRFESDLRPAVSAVLSIQHELAEIFGTSQFDR